jgi:hypothetical protein
MYETIIMKNYIFEIIRRDKDLEFLSIREEFKWRRIISLNKINVINSGPSHL